MNEIAARPASVDVDPLSAELLDALDSGRPLPTLTGRMELDATAAYRVAGALRRAREARGARHVGRKIGFSNRTIWPVYVIDAPMWGDMFAETVREVAPGDEVPLDRLIEPRIEPEIAFGLSATPDPVMSDAELLGCCACLAHGVELVQSPYPGWQFGAPDTIVAGGLHGMLLLGPRPAGPEWLAQLGDFACRLLRDGELQADGHSSNVLGRPLQVLRHLAALLAADPEGPALAPGKIVTTGTLTDALPVQVGQRWTTKLVGVDLPGIDIRLV